MNSTPGGTNRRMTLAEADAVTVRERRRIIILGVCALLLFGAYLTAQVNKPPVEDRGADLPTGAGSKQSPSVYTLPFESPEILETIQDATPDDRLALSGEALDSLLKYSITLGRPNYEALGGRPLTADVAAELAEAPGEHRIDPLFARGLLLRLTAISTKDPAVRERQLAAIELEGGGIAHLAFLRPTELQVGEFVRLDGLFVQQYRGMVNGDLREGPLLAGNQLLPSFASTGELSHEDLVHSLRQDVEDDTVDRQLGEPTEALWQLMSFAAQSRDQIDWAAAEELTTENLALISNGGTFFRGQPFRLPVCQNLGIWTESAGENGMRLGRLSRGWIGNTTWKDPAPLVQFVSPLDLSALQDRQKNRLLTGKVFFLKNTHYKRRDGKSTAMAPLFVVAELEHFIPVADRTPEYILFGVLAGTILMMVLIFFLVRADSRSSKKLQEELVRRRRERRARADQAEAPSQSQ